jgi:uncharacterized membrane protein YesL
MSDEKIFEVAPGEHYEDDRSRLNIFFQVLGRKFWKLITINLMFILFNLPAMIISFFFCAFLTNLLIPAELVVTGTDLLSHLVVLGVPLTMSLMAIPIITVGPAQAGMTYLMRCFAYEIPTFTWSDFKDKMKENLKQGLLVSLINLIAITFLLYDIYLYTQLNAQANPLLSIANGLLVVVFALFLMMNLYLYPMMVSYQLKTKHLYKNALLFAFGKFIPNLGILLLCGVIILGPMIIGLVAGAPIIIGLGLVLYVTLGFSLTSYIINFFINPIIDKYLKPADAGEESAEG